MKKNVVVLAGALALVAAVGLGSTFAYFTDKEEVSNIVTMGHVDITLTETSKDGVEDLEKGGIKFDNVVPGDVEEKIVTVATAEGSQPAYVRVSIDMKWDDEDVKVELPDTLLNIGSDWVKDGDYYYYVAKNEEGEVTGYKELAAGASANVFTEVSLPIDWNNAVADEAFTITIKAEAVQSKNVELGDWAKVAEVEKYVAPVDGEQ